jgi:hypothetical protein
MVELKQIKFENIEIILVAARRPNAHMFTRLLSCYDKLKPNDAVEHANNMQNVFIQAKLPGTMNHLMVDIDLNVSPVTMQCAFQNLMMYNVSKWKYNVVGEEYTAVYDTGPPKEVRQRRDANDDTDEDRSSFSSSDDESDDESDDDNDDASTTIVQEFRTKYNPISTKGMIFDNKKHFFDDGKSETKNKNNFKGVVEIYLNYYVIDRLDPTVIIGTSWDKYKKLYVPQLQGHTKLPQRKNMLFQPVVKCTNSYNNLDKKFPKLLESYENTIKTLLDNSEGFKSVSMSLAFLDSLRQAVPNRQAVPIMCQNGYRVVLKLQYNQQTRLDWKDSDLEELKKLLANKKSSMIGDYVIIDDGNEVCEFDGNYVPVPSTPTSYYNDNKSLQKSPRYVFQLMISDTTYFDFPN